MADDGDSVRCVGAAKVRKPVECALLYITHLLAGGNCRDAAAPIEPSPLIVAVEILKRAAGPLAKVNFINFFGHSDRDGSRAFTSIRHCGGCFLSALHRARVHNGDWQTAETLAQTVSL